MKLKRTHSMKNCAGPASKKRAPALFTAILGAGILLCPSAASALETQSLPPGSAAHKAAAMHNQVPPVGADLCAPLRKSLSYHHTPPAPEIDRAQRNAGQAATLALMFGVRFALGPVQEAPRKPMLGDPRFELSLTGNQYDSGRAALAVREFNDCRKKQALVQQQAARRAD